MHNVEYHISKYTQIIAQLKGEVSDLKTQLKTSLGNQGIFNAPALSYESLERSKEELTGHFIEEVKTKKRIHELEQKMESAALSLMTKKNEIQATVRDKGKDSLPAKLLQEEIDEINTQMRELKT